MQKIWLPLVLAWCVTGTAAGQVAVTANDNKLVLVNGVQTVVKNPAPDSVSLVDLGATPPRLLATVEHVPTSVIGPPLCIAITPDEALALVTASMKIDPADPTKQTEDNRVTVLDLKAVPPKVLATVEAGKGPAGISINRAGTLALVANRGEGSVSVFSIAGKVVKNEGKLEVGNAASALGHVAITPDGKRALLTRDGDNTVTVLAIDGTKVTLAGRDIKTGLRPYGIDITPDGKYAVVANIGAGNGDMDSLGVIDLTAAPPRLVDLIPVPQTPEGLKLSLDGKWCAVVCQDGSNKAADSPFYNAKGRLIVFRVEGAKLIRTAEAAVGGWPQGVAFSSDGRKIVVTSMVEKEIQTFTLEGTALREVSSPIKLPGGVAAIRTVEK